ncbi:MAG: hypothetical protein JKY54_10955 [Flavobacteriales bacterium]|nr:hypothetical protein [Flavobacteriales bacterium]
MEAGRTADRPGLSSDEVAQREAAPLHLKDVTVADLEAIGEFAEHAPDNLRQDYKTAIAWLSEEKKYESVPLGKPQFAAFSGEEVARMVRAGHVLPVAEEELHSVRGYAKLFPVLEHREAGWRKRIIKHPIEANIALGKETLLGVSLPSRRVQEAQAFEGKWAAHVDFAAFFDAIPLTRSVSFQFCFICGDEVFRYTKLLMGIRHAVDVAECIARVMANCCEPGVSAQTNVDNTRFVGEDKKAVLKTLITYYERCAAANLRLNETFSEDLIVQQGTWLGAIFDYEKKLVWNTDKTLSKIEKSWSLREEWTHKSLACHLSLLFYASRITDVNIGRHFAALKVYRRLSQHLQANPSDWKAMAQISIAQFQDLGRWTQEVISNTKRGFRGTRKKDADVYLFVDASKYGWGAVLYDREFDYCRSYGQRWSNDFNMIQRRRSTTAEPRALIEAAKKFISPASKRSYVILTDSVTAKAIHNRGYAKAFDVNSWAAAFKELFANVDIRIEFVAGKDNFADAPSRGIQESIKISNLMDYIRRYDLEATVSA